MYLSNKYTRWYYNIIYGAKSRAINPIDYHEKHHIIPKALGGVDSSSNLIKLTAREHLICHRLLIKMTEGKARSKMAFAAWRMVFMGKNHSRHKVTARTYEALKKEMSIARKLSKGSYKHTKESKMKISKGNKGKRLGKSLSLQWKKNIGDSRRGEVRGPLPLATIEKIKAAKLGKKLPKFTKTHRLNMAKSKLGKRHYNNGVMGVLCSPGEEPIGFKPGKLLKKLGCNQQSQNSG